MTIPFTATLGATELSCGADAEKLQLTDLRFFVFSPTLSREDGSQVRIELGENDRWQNGDLVLIDLEDGRSACQNGTSDTNSLVTGIVPAGDYRGLRFTVGVPFDANHADPLAALPPLDDSTMHWHWRSGYKFLRAGVARDDDSFWIHLGSAGCEGSVRNIRGCAFPNRFDVELPAFEPGNRVRIDLSALVEAAALDDGIPADCASGPAETPCAAAFRVFGIDFSSGTQTAPQQVFVTQP